MLAFVNFLAIKSKTCLILFLLSVIETAFGLKNDYNFDFTVRQTSFCLRQCTINSTQRSSTIRAQSLNKFDALCKQLRPINSTLEASQYYYSSQLTFDRNTGTKYSVFIFDFYLVSGDVYIDFTRFNLSNIHKQLKPESNISLIISLVANQFMTFRIFNLPSRKSMFLSNVKILLNGAANLDLIEKKGDLSIEVYHSPLYNYSPDRTEWLNYLQNLIGVKISGYVEYLSQFCHVSHIRIDLNKMVHNMHNVKNFQDFVEPLEKMPSIRNNMDSELTQYYFGKKFSLNVNESEFLHDFEKTREYFAVNLEPHIFLDIGQNLDQNENYLKIFIKKCDVAKIYNLILFVNQLSDQKSGGHKPKKLILDENYCQIKVYANVDVYSLIDDRFVFKKFEYGVIDRKDFNESDAGFETDFREKIFKLLNKNLIESFVYMKVLPKATEIELRFFSTNHFDYSAADKFYNTMNHQIILEKETDTSSISKENSESNYSIKFAILESVVKEYFHSNGIDLRAYLGYTQIQKISNFDLLSEKSDESEFFWISDKQCRVIIIDSEIFPRYPYLLIFNSNLYINQSNCYYFDQATKIFHMVLGFSFFHENFTKTIYFNMKQSTQELNEFNYLNRRLEVEREKSIRGYYNNILLKVIESNYRVESKSELKESEASKKKFEITSSVKFNSLDDSVSWFPEFCWLAHLDCIDYVDQFFFSKNPLKHDYDYYNEVVFPLHMQPDFDMYPNLVRNRRYFDYEFQTESEIVNHTLLNFSTNIQRFKTKKKFLHQIEFKIELSVKPNYFKYVLCNFKPYASCNQSLKLNYNYSGQKSHLNEACEETKIKQFFEQNSVEKKTKTILVSEFDSEGILKATVHYDSSSANSDKIPCSKLIPRSALDDAYLPTSSIWSESKSLSSTAEAKSFHNTIKTFFSMNKLTIILIFVSVCATIFLIILVRLILKKSNGSNLGEFNSNMTKTNIEMKPLNRCTVECTNGENKELCKLLSEQNQKNAKLLKKERELKKKFKFDLKGPISEV